MVSNETVKIDNDYYKFNENGELNVETPEVKSGWVQSGNDWHIFKCVCYTISNKRKG